MQTRDHIPPGPETDFKGLYVSVNLCLLCEEMATVMTAGQAYGTSTQKQHSVIVLLKIDYEENWTFFTEPGAWRRVIMNVIGNALKYTMEGLVTIKLVSSMVDPGHSELGGDNSSRRTVTLSVKDTGKGISKDFLENHLFVPFTQEDVTSSRGVGLGMSIVKSLVTLLGGNIKVSPFKTHFRLLTNQVLGRK